MAPPPEIAIPSTSVSGEGTSKPFTLYNITLRLPLRSFVVQKRYSDFSALHATLTKEIGAPPPEPLPGKTWLKSTVNSAQLTQDRQAGLERYLKAIAESPDRRWRDTSAWRAFLNLPNISTTNSAVSASGRIGNAAAGAADPGTWLDIHRELKQCLHDSRQSLSKRDTAVDAGNHGAAAEAGAAAKRALVKGGTLISTLSDGLRKMQEASRLGEGELRRRRDLLSSVRMERDGLDKLANTMPTPSGGSARHGLTQGQSSTSERASLMKEASPAAGSWARPCLRRTRRGSLTTTVCSCSRKKRCRHRMIRLMPSPPLSADKRKWGSKSTTRSRDKPRCLRCWMRTQTGSRGSLTLPTTASGSSDWS
uniref:PX domain-containing protein n=1 Tax=Bionectria ochroleuca TaxID=29856 RepID=A0A8H7NP33_BIOOC